MVSGLEGFHCVCVCVCVYIQMQQAQQARANIHSGGGSMPSLAAIDSTPLPPSIDMQVCVPYHVLCALRGKFVICRLCVHEQAFL